MRRSILIFALVAPFLVLSGCDRDDAERIPLQLSTEPIVFEDEFGDVIFEPFANAFQTAVTIGDQETYDGSAGSIRIDVQPLSEGPYSGGAFTAGVARDLTGYNVLSLQIKASADVRFDRIGIGEGNTGASLYQASMANVLVTTEWQQLLIPIPRPSRLRAERGMLYFSDTVGGADPADGYTIWIDEVQWATRGGVSVISAQVPAGSTEAVQGTPIVFEPDGRLPRVQFDVQGTTRTVDCRSWYFDYFDAADSNDTSPVIRFDRGVARVVGGGTALIRASLGDVDAVGTFEVTGVAPPATDPPRPTYASGDVLSIFSDPYPDNGVDSFRPEFGAGTFYRLGEPGDETIAYTGFTFEQEIYIEFASQQIDASSYTHFRVDVWLPAPDSGDPLVAIRLNDFGADGIYSPTVDDSSGKIGRGLGALVLPTGEWITLEFPLEDFEPGTPSVGVALAPGLEANSNIAQVGIQTNTGYVFLDNLLFFRATAGTGD